VAMYSPTGAVYMRKLLLASVQTDLLPAFCSGQPTCILSSQT
jgi:hypothetical protein